MKRLNVLLPEPVHRELKLAAFSREETVSAVITRLVTEFLLVSGVAVAGTLSGECLPEAARSEERLGWQSHHQLVLLQSPDPSPE